MMAGSCACPIILNERSLSFLRIIQKRPAFADPRYNINAYIYYIIKGDAKVGKLSNSQLKALDELLFDYVSIDHKIAVRKLEISDVPNDDENIGGGRTNIVSKPTENLVAKWDSDQRLNSLYAQKHAVESTLSTLDEDMTQIFWLRWSRGSVNTWEEIADKMAYDRSTIYRRRQRILEIFADFYGFC